MAYGGIFWVEKKPTNLLSIIMFLEIKNATL